MRVELSSVLRDHSSAAPLRTSHHRSRLRRATALSLSQYSERSRGPLSCGSDRWGRQSRRPAAVTGGRVSTRHPADKVYDKLAAVKQPSLIDIKRHYVVEGRSL